MDHAYDEQRFLIDAARHARFPLPDMPPLPPLGTKVFPNAPERAEEPARPQRPTIRPREYTSGPSYSERFRSIGGGPLSPEEIARLRAEAEEEGHVEVIIKKRKKVKNEKDPPDAEKSSRGK